MKIYFFLVLLFICAAVKAQTLPLDETTRKISFEEIVKLDSVSSDKLYHLADQWINSNFKSKDLISQFDIGGGLLESEGMFLVYTKGMVSKEIHGDIRFKVRIDIKSNKYRYQFYDFVFEYYKQNRQYQYVPTGKKKPLEDTKFPGWEKPWSRYKQETLIKINNYIASLKATMNYKEPVIIKNPVVKVKKEAW